MRKLSAIAGVGLGLAFTTLAIAAEFEDYPQFRYISGLPGGGYGVDQGGDVGFNGALQVNIPVAYTPRNGNYTVAGHSGATNGGIQLGMAGDDVNGTLTIGVGFGPAGGGLYLADMNTGNGHWGEPAHNVQYQILPESEDHPAVAIGVVDVLDMRPRKLSRIFEGGGRSLYATATRRTGSEEHPAYWTVGLGNGRFNNNLFGGVSYQWTDRLKLAGEYDGFNLNAAAAWDAWSSDEWHAIVLAGLTDLDRWTLGATVTRAPD